MPRSSANWFTSCMESASSPKDILALVTKALDRSGVPYMVTGSMASSFHGTPRTTQDIDIVIAPDRSTLGALVSELGGPEYYVSREAALEALDRRSMFNVIHVERGWKIDFIICKSRAFSQEEFRRRQEGDFWGTPAFLATAEDVLIAKLEWAKAGQSERQIHDAAGILKAQSDRLDRSYIKRWVRALGLDHEWQAAQGITS